MFILNPYRYAKGICYTTFDGTNEYVNVDGLATSCASNNVGSWSIWFNKDNNPVSFYSLICFGDTNATEYLKCLIRSTGEIQIVSAIAGVVKFNARTNNTFANNTWYHVVVVQDGVSPVIYVNGVSQTLTFLTSTDTTVWNSSYTGLDNCRLGVEFSTSTNIYYLNGNLDKIIIYDDVLTSGEVTTIYNYGRKAGLIGIGNEVSQWEMYTPNPIDVIGSNNGTSVNMDSSNIVCE